MDVKRPRTAALQVIAHNEAHLALGTFRPAKIAFQPPFLARKTSCFWHTSRHAHVCRFSLHLNTVMANRLLRRYGTYGHAVETDLWPRWR